MTAATVKYGLRWDDPPLDDLQIELRMIRAGGYIEIDGKRYGEGLFHHYRAAESLAWPTEDHHRWSDLMLTHLCNERIVVVQGSRDGGKTRRFSKWVLLDYWSSPENTLTIMTSTGLRELEMRVWGDIKSLFKRARERWPWIPGNINHANRGLFTDSLEEQGDVRDMRRGIICIPLRTTDGEYELTALENFAGIKQERRRLIGDETQFVPVAYLNVLDAIDKGDFKGGFLGNPIGGNGKTLDRIAEPVGGWSSIDEPKKTTVWRNKYGGVTINLVGTDSPNFDPDRPKKYPYLIDAEDVERVASRNGRDSAQFYTLILGVRKTGVDLYRVLTFEMCEKHHAFLEARWSGSPRVRIYAIDAGYGGDPCEAMYAEFGEDVDGNQIVELSETKTIQINLNLAAGTPEQQIAFAAKADCAILGVPPENVFFDAGMRAILGVTMAGILGSEVNAINFGGPATDRPVSGDLFTIDQRTKQRRPLRCDEQYSKFVTELWYSMNEAVLAEQIRGMPKNVAEEFAMREWHWVPGPVGQRYELETKDECKKRMGHSPNRADVATIALEGARRRGFVIRNPNVTEPLRTEDDDWLRRELEKHRAFVKKSELTYR